MGLTHINTNMSALNAQRNLALNTIRLATSMERLSSGLRINRAADDPAGLVLSETLRAQISGLDVVQQNVAQGINLMKTAEGGLTEVNALLRQMNDLALNAASNSNNTVETRASLQEQVESALVTINQIAANTTYAGAKLLDGTAGVDATILDTTNIASAQLTSTAGAGYVDIDITVAATKAQHDGTNTYASAATVLDNAGSMSINGTSIGTYTTANTVQEVIDDINGLADTTGVSAVWDTDHVELNQTSYGVDNKIVYVESADLLNGGSTAVKEGIDAVATVTWGDATVATMNQGDGLTLQDADGNIITLTEAGNGVGVDPQDGIYVTIGELSFQIGVTAGETASISINSVAAADLGTTAALSTVDVSTVSGAQDALTVIGEAIDEVSALRAKLGAFQTNQMESQGRSLAVARENLAASESAIRDTDFGAEMAEFATTQILVQAATAFLAQANALPQNVLSLIR